MDQSPDLKILYKQDQLPVFQNRMYDTPEAAKACPRGDLVLVEHQKTGLIFNAAFEPDLVVYDGAYQNEQAVSGMFREHLNQVVGIIDRGMGRENLIEVGCGKGFFLEMLLEKGFDLTGFDPAYEGDNPRVKRHFFEPGLGIEAEGLILRHVLEHIQNPYGFLKQLAKSNGGGGKIYIEVPCFDWICERRNWFDVFYEHVNYFRLSNFHQMFGNVIDSGRVFGGQYLYVVADLASLRDPKALPGDMVRFPEDFADGLSSFDSRNMRDVVVWGGASKGVIFALLNTRHGNLAPIVVDINPAKQGKFLPATGIEVRSPDILQDLPKETTIFIMNSNYADEIRRMSDNAFQYIEVDNA